MLQRILQQNALRNAAKRSAICTKMHCNMHQNALQNAPKCTAMCTKTHCNMQQNAAKTHEKHHFRAYL
jgi:hypothetical protein